VVGAPMLLDNNGNAVFIYTPPSLRMLGVSKAKDKRHAAKMFKRAMADTTGRWAAFHFPSHDNPHISAEALEEIAADMTELAYQQEIMAEDIDEVPGALWKRQNIKRWPTGVELPQMARVAVGVDPSGGVAEIGIIVAGVDSQGIGYVLADNSLLGSPATWGSMVVASYDEFQADVVDAEKNYGGEMVESTIKRAVEGGERVNVKLVNATRGKVPRAEPVSAKYERGLVYHVGEFPELEEEQCGWVPNSGMPSPNRLDALVWALTDLMLGQNYGPPGSREY